MDTEKLTSFAGFKKGQFQCHHTLLILFSSKKVGYMECESKWELTPVLLCSWCKLTGLDSSCIFLEHSVLSVPQQPRASTRLLV